MIDQVRTILAARLVQMKERGASAVEYGLLIAGIAALIVVAIFALGPMIQGAFEDTCSAIATEDSDAATLATDCAE